MTSPITPPSITALGTPPSTSDPATFDSRADSFLGSLPTLATEINATTASTYQNAVSANESAVSADADAASALASKNAASISESNALASKNAASTSESNALASKNAAQAAATQVDVAGALAGLPPRAGNALKSIRVNAGETALEYYADGASPLIGSTRTSNTILGAGDSGKLIDVTSGTFTQTLTAAATLGDGWWCYYRNRGSGVVTIDPNGSETIDGVTSGTIPPGMTILIQCNGTAFNCVRIGAPVKMEVLTSGTSWTCPLGVRNLRVRGVGGGGGTDFPNGCTIASGGGYFESWRSVVPGTAYIYSIGAGGSTTAPCTGGLTGWDSNAIFGNGGTSNNNVQTVVAGGTASGQIAIFGGAAMFNDDGSSGLGGNTPLGQGGASQFGATYTKVNPSGYGSGAATTSTLASVAGQPGVIILEY